MKYGPFPMWPAFPTPEYHDPLRLPLDHPNHFPVLPAIGGHRFPRPTGDGAKTALPGSHNNRSRVQRPLRRSVPQRPLLKPGRFPWPSPYRQQLGTLLTRHTTAGSA